MKYYLIIPMTTFVVLGLLVLFVGLYWRSNPEGKYNGYVLYQHDSADTVIFHDGVVTYSTCCGQSNWGTYTIKDGVMDWDWRRGKPFKFLTAKVVPGWFGATVIVSGLEKDIRIWVRRKITESTVL